MLALQKMTRARWPGLRAGLFRGIGEVGGVVSPLGFRHPGRTAPGMCQDS
jgi:hypothetical protein